MEIFMQNLMSLALLVPEISAFKQTKKKLYFNLTDLVSYFNV